MRIAVRPLRAVRSAQYHHRHRETHRFDEGEQSKTDTGWHRNHRHGAGATGAVLHERDIGVMGSLSVDDLNGRHGQ